MTSYNQPNSDQLWWRYFSQFVSEMLHSFHQDSITCKCASQYIFSSVLLPWQHTGFQISPVLKAFLVAWHSILIFVNGASCVWSSKHINMLPVSRVCYLLNIFSSFKSLTYEMKRVGTGKEWVAMGTIFFLAKGVFHIELLALTQWSALQIGQDTLQLNLYTWYNIGLSV